MNGAFYAILALGPAALGPLPEEALARLVREVISTCLSLEQPLRIAYLGPDLKVVRALANQVIVMRNGKVVERGPAEAIFERPQSGYTRALIAAAFWANGSSFAAASAIFSASVAPAPAGAVCQI